jgi:hypothetical protein
LRARHRSAARAPPCTPPAPWQARTGVISLGLLVGGRREELRIGEVNDGVVAEVDADERRRPGQAPDFSLRRAAAADPAETSPTLGLSS